ncbi:hypothetical protein EAH80_18360 [Mycobacterium hodleri]|uniref:Uncharacterized protein n=2 Tax=Mycolicibacterium hodleri TaxID=49897 RepID=A0A502E5Y6_9MYCO|nr:hypothetical protein EAH80_18360 [Mycolicibacterium hodleri]
MVATTLRGVTGTLASSGVTVAAVLAFATLGAAVTVTVGDTVGAGTLAVLACSREDTTDVVFALSAEAVAALRLDRMPAGGRCPRTGAATTESPPPTTGVDAVVEARVLVVSLLVASEPLVTTPLTEVLAPPDACTTPACGSVDDPV